MKIIYAKIRAYIERFIPMTIGSLLMFIFVIYLMVVVGRTVALNYRSNLDIKKEEAKLVQMQKEIKQKSNLINYLQTYSYKEKQAREKLGYIAPGEKVISLPPDSIEEGSEDSELSAPEQKIPNYRLWWEYFFKH